LLVKPIRSIVAVFLSLVLASCQTLQELGRSMDQIGASLVRNLTTAPAPASERAEIVQPLTPELAERRAAGELRGVVVVNDASVGPAATESLRALAIQPAGEAIPLAATEPNAGAEDWFASLPGRTAEPGAIAESELLVAAYVATAPRTNEQGEARRDVTVELRAFDRAAQSQVFAGRATADDPHVGAPPVPARAAHLIAAIAAKTKTP
jgi:hypothetical protein